MERYGHLWLFSLLPFSLIFGLSAAILLNVFKMVKGIEFMLEDAKYLTENEKQALAEIKRRISDLFEVRQFILFGSKARGDASPDSDIDLLLVTGRELEQGEKHLISDAIFEVNLHYDTLFSFIAVDEKQWNSRLYSFYPIHINIQREGISV